MQCACEDQYVGPVLAQMLVLLFSCFFDVYVVACPGLYLQYGRSQCLWRSEGIDPLECQLPLVVSRHVGSEN